MTRLPSSRSASARRDFGRKWLARFRCRDGKQADLMPMALNGFNDQAVAAGDLYHLAGDVFRPGSGQEERGCK